MRLHLVGGSVILLLGLALAGGALARPPHGHKGFDRDPGGFIEKHAEKLGLDAETVTRIEKIVEESRGAGEQFRDQIHALHQAMRDLLSQDDPDRSVVMAQAGAIGGVETEMHKHRLSTMLEVRALLTPEQRRELARLREDARGRFHSMLESCRDDAERLCSHADDRWSRKQCMREHSEELSGECRDAIEALPKKGRGERGPGRGRGGFGGRRGDWGY